MARLRIFLSFLPARSLAFPFSLLALAAVSARGASEPPAPSAPPAESPFLPSPDASNPRPESPAETYALIGMTVVGHDTLLSITRLSDKRSFWIPVGKTANGITVVSYDTRADRAVIRADGQTLTLVLRKAEAVAHPATAPAPTPALAAPVVAGTAPATGTATATPPGVVPNRPMSVQEEKEMEARMLVTDLLEIGQQQRKAYEEAQRQAAARARSASAPPAAPATPPSPPEAPPPK